MKKEENFSILDQLASDLEENIEKMRKAYEDRNTDEFVQLKKAILNIYRKINKILD